MNGKAATFAEKGYYSPRIVAQKTKYDRTTIYRWIKEGHVKTVSFNGHYYIEWRSVVAYMQALSSIIDLSEPTLDATGNLVVGGKAKKCTVMTSKRG